MPRTLVDQLFLLNVALQLFDGVATYQGVRWWGEGNPWIQETMRAFGVGPALLLFKAQACGFVLIARRLPSSAAATGVLGLGALAYLAFSFVPWMQRFVWLATV